MPLWKTGAVVFSNLLLLALSFIVRVFLTPPSALRGVWAGNHNSVPLDFTFRDGPLFLCFAQCCRLVNWTAMSWNDCVGPNCSAPRHCRSTLFFFCECVCVCFFFLGGGSIWVFLLEYPPQLFCYWSYVTRTHGKWDLDDSSKWAPERKAECLTSTLVVSLKS